MASYPSTDEMARKILTADYESDCPHDGAYLGLSGDAMCPTCGQQTWRWKHVPNMVQDSTGARHWCKSWEATDTPEERLTCICRRVFHAGVLDGHRTPADAFFHHMEALHEQSSPALEVTFIGTDHWGRPIYRDKNRRRLVDVALRAPNEATKLHTVTSEGEPIAPIAGRLVFMSKGAVTPQ
jgi:hypothetical protein